MSIFKDLSKTQIRRLEEEIEDIENLKKLKSTIWQLSLALVLAFFQAIAQLVIMAFKLSKGTA